VVWKVLVLLAILIFLASEVTAKMRGGGLLAKKPKIYMITKFVFTLQQRTNFHGYFYSPFIFVGGGGDAGGR